MRNDMNGTEHFSWTDGLRFAGLALLAALAIGSGAHGQPATREPPGLPPADWPTSPHHAVIDGWGRTIPCRCRFNGNTYRLGEIVCMRTHVGPVLARCDIFENNTSWVPSSQACQPDVGT